MLPKKFVSFVPYFVNGYSKSFAKCSFTVPRRNAGSPNRLSCQLQARIKATGPITVADYMTEVLTSPVRGYYMHRDVFGNEGDFVTSPEISQMFGELLTIWFLSEWAKVGSPRPLQLIELGPGRGSLMRDVLKVLEYFGVAKDISAHLVEVSQYMSKLQAQTLGVQLNKPANPPQSGHTASGIPVHWHSHIQDVPRQFSFVYANEFFDALPIHKFQRTADGWREILVDLDPEAKGNCFRYVISRTPTPASTLFIKANEKRDHIEVSPRSAVIIQHLASRLEEDGGIALFVDYGHDGTKTDTFRAFYKHKLHDPLVEPGSADLTADVDFSYLREAAESKLITFGPVNQGYFLKKMGVDTRLQVLLQNCDAEQQESLQSGYHMIVNHDKMGERFKIFCMFPAVLKDHLAKYPVLGFTDLQ